MYKVIPPRFCAESTNASLSVCFTKLVRITDHFNKLKKIESSDSNAYDIRALKLVRTVSRHSMIGIMFETESASTNKIRMLCHL